MGRDLRSGGAPFEMIEDALDHHRVFNAGNHPHCAAAVLAGIDVDAKYPLQAPCLGSRCMPLSRALLALRTRSPAAPGRGHQFTICRRFVGLLYARSCIVVRLSNGRPT